MSRRSAFTLVELLVVIAIFALLTGLLLAAIQAARESARQAQCASNLKQIGVALLTFHDAKRRFPAGYSADGKYADGWTDTSPGWGWATRILPYLEETNLRDAMDLRLPVNAAANRAAVETHVAIYLCPSDQPPDAAFWVVDESNTPLASCAPASYVACVGGDESGIAASKGQGIFFRNSHTRIAEITDGTSNTIAVGERAWAITTGTWAGVVAGGGSRARAAQRQPAR